MNEGGTKAVFLSYASQDAEAAKHIAEALRASGVEVWFDQNELVSGDVWDAKIRGQIASCALFAPVISANTQARLEGYFRIEWKLAAQRTLAMADEKAFLLPVVIDDTHDVEAKVPTEFRAVQWTRLRSGDGVEKFCTRVQRLLGGTAAEAASPQSAADVLRHKAAPTRTRLPRWLTPVLTVVVVVTAVLLAVTLKTRFGATTASATSSPSLPTLVRVRSMLDKFDVTRAELDLAGELLAQAVKGDPANARLFASWAMVDCRYLTEFYDRSSERRNAASRHMAQATGLDAADPEVRIARGTTMRTFNDDDATRTEARTLLEALQNEFPADPRILGELGWLAKDVTEAEGWWDRQVRVPGWEAAAGFNRAMRRNSAQDFSGVYAALAETSSHVKSTKVLLWKAYLEIIWLGDPAKSRGTMAEVTADAFVEDMAASARYFVAFWSRDYQQALAAVQAVPRDYMESGASISPTGFMRGAALDRLGRSAAAENEWRAALAATERRIDADRNNWRLLLGKAVLLAVLNDKPAAEQVWRTARELQGEAGDWLDDYLAAMLLPPEQEIERLEKRVHSPNGWITAAILRLNPYYDHLRDNPRFVALQADADANPRLSPTAAERARPENQNARLRNGADEKSVAVLPFTNMSEDKDASTFFSDGIQEDILTNLANVADLHVVSRTSVMEYRGTTKKIRQIALELGVAYVLEGSVRRAGTKVRVTGQLIKAATDEHVWAKTYDRDLTDIFAIQSELAQAITGALSAVLTPQEKSLLERAPTDNIAAYEFFLQARKLYRLDNAFDFPALRKSYDDTVARLEQAVQLDPKFVAAWVQLAAVNGLMYFTNNDHSESRLARIRTAIDAATRLAPDDPAVALAQGRYYYYTSHDWAKAREQGERVLAHWPGHTETRIFLATVAQRQGRWTDALGLLRQVVTDDPRNPDALESLVWLLISGRRYDEAAAVARTLTGIRPDSVLFAGWPEQVNFFATGAARGSVDAFTGLPNRQQTTIPTMRSRFENAWTFGDATDLLHWADALRAAGAKLDDARLPHEGVALLATGEKERGGAALLEARRSLESYLPVQPANWGAWVRLAESCAYLQDEPAALAAFDKAAALAPFEQDAIYGPLAAMMHALALAWNGHEAAAVQELSRLLKAPCGSLFGTSVNVHHLRVGLEWAPLRDRPDFQALLADPKNNAPLF